MFNKTYFALSVVIFIIEVLTALFVRDRFVRPYLGDVLVVILLYCFTQSFFRLPVFIVAAGVLLFSFIMEFLQYIHIVNKLGLEKSVFARTVMGTSFAWHDLVAYTAGIGVVLLVEKLLKKDLFTS